MLTNRSGREVSGYNSQVPSQEEPTHTDHRSARDTNRHQQTSKAELVASQRPTKEGLMTNDHRPAK